MIVIRWIFSFPLAESPPRDLQITTHKYWSAHALLPSKLVLLQIIFCSWVIIPWAARKWLKYENKLGDRMIKQLLYSIIAKYRDFLLSRRSMASASNWSACHWQITLFCWPLQCILFPSFSLAENPSRYPQMNT